MPMRPCAHGSPVPQGPPWTPQIMKTFWGKTNIYPQKRSVLWKLYSQLKQWTENSQQTLLFKNGLFFFFFLSSSVFILWNNISLTEINSSKLILPSSVVVKFWTSSLALYPGSGRLAAFNTSVKSLAWMKPFPLTSAKIKKNVQILYQPNEIFCTQRPLLLFHLKKCTLHIKICYPEVHYFQALQWHLHPKKITVTV